MDKIQNILKFAMRMEKDAEDFYTYYADKMKSKTARELFTELSETEKKHYQIIKDKYDALGFVDAPTTISWVVDNTFTSKDPGMLSTNADYISEDGEDGTDISIMRMAYLMESDFAIFYNNAYKAVEDADAKKLLKELSDWEIGHKELFYSKYQDLMKKHWGDIASIIFDD